MSLEVPVIVSVLELLAGSRSSTPSLARKSPSIDQAVQVSPNKDKKAIQPPVPREGYVEDVSRGVSNDTSLKHDWGLLVILLHQQN